MRIFQWYLPELATLIAMAGGIVLYWLIRRE
jgi:hypothetical protein